MPTKEKIIIEATDLTLDSLKILIQGLFTNVITDSQRYKIKLTSTGETKP